MMSNPTQKNSRLYSDPSLKDVLNASKDEILLSTNCHAIATVQKFDSATQLTTATMNYKRTYFTRNPDGTYSPTLVAYPVLVDMPTLFIGGGGKDCALTFPVAAGDEALICFNDRDFDNWYQSGQVTGVATPRLHSFSDGIAIIGLRNSTRTIQNFDTTRAVLRKGTTGVGVGDSKVKVYNQSTTLNTLLQQLINDIKAITTIPAVVGSPLTLNPASIAALAADATAIAGLLE